MKQKGNGVKPDVIRAGIIAYVSEYPQTPRKKIGIEVSKILNKFYEEEVIQLNQICKFLDDEELYAYPIIIKEELGYILNEENLDKALIELAKVLWQFVKKRDVLGILNLREM